jgi:hypothetical protein
MIGQGIAGLAMVTIRMITLAFIQPEEVQTNSIKAFIGSLIYFFIASLIIVCCIIGYCWVRKSRFARYHVKKAGNKIEEYSFTFEYRALTTVSFVNPNMLANLTQDNSDDQESDPELSNTSKIPCTFFQVYAKIWPMALQVLL